MISTETKKEDVLTKKKRLLPAISESSSSKLFKPSTVTYSSSFREYSLSHPEINGRELFPIEIYRMFNRLVFL